MDSIEYRMKRMVLKNNDLSLMDIIKSDDQISIKCWPTVTILNMSRSKWGQGSVYDKNPNKVNFTLFRHVATNTMYHLTLLDLWHPSSATGHMTPPNSLHRSELVSVNVHALEIFSTHPQNIVDLRLCSCICSFGPDELKSVLTNSFRLKRLYLRCSELRYDFLEVLSFRHLEILHLETNVVDLDELTRWMRMFLKAKLFALRCGLVHGGRRLDDHDFGLPKCEVNALQDMDVMSACWS